MRVIVRRVAKLEDRIAPREVRTEDKRIMQLAVELRERRRRRMEAMGLPFEETPLPPDCTGPPFDLAKVLRMRPRRPAISVAAEGKGNSA
jgi:hypothetical protein